MPKKPLISIVDDDESVREGTMDLVRSMGFVAKAFPRPEDFLNQPQGGRNDPSHD
jgi:FixJ family two-component response regulator